MLFRNYINERLFPSFNKHRTSFRKYYIFWHNFTFKSYIYIQISLMILQRRKNNHHMTTISCILLSNLFIKNGNFILIPNCSSSQNCQLYDFMFKNESESFTLFSRELENCFNIKFSRRFQKLFPRS